MTGLRLFTTGQDDSDLPAIPASWQWRKLGEVADVVGGVTKDAKKQADSSLPEVPYLRVANVQRAHLDLSTVTTIRVPQTKIDQLRMLPGDVLFNEGGDRDKLGRGWVWEGQIDPCIHQNHVFRARIHDRMMDSKFLSFWANSFGGKWCERNGTQSVNLASISLNKIRQMPVPMPPLNEQRRIVDVLEDHLSRIDAASDYLDSASMRTGDVISAALRQMLPVDAGMLALAEVLALPLSNGRSVPTASHAGFPVLRLTAIRSDRIDLRQRKQGDWSPQDASGFLVKEGDFFLARGNGSHHLVGRGALVRDAPDAVAFPDTMIRVRLDTSIVDPDFFALVWAEQSVRRQVEGAARTTAGIYKVNQKDLGRIMLPIPPLSVQMEVAHRVRGFADVMGRTRSVFDSARRRSEALRRALLRAAFTGRLTGRPSGMDLTETATG